MTHGVHLAAKLAQFQEHWPPRTVAQLNDYDIMVIKVKGEFVWHKHDDTDDFFFVLSGQLTIPTSREHDDRDVALLAQEAADREAIKAGKHHVEHNQVRVVTACELQATTPSTASTTV